LPSTAAVVAGEEQKEDQRVGREDKRQIWILYEFEKLGKPRRMLVANKSRTGFSLRHWPQQFLEDADADDVGRQKY